MFNCNTVKEVIRDTKKCKALGPDRVVPIQLLHLGPTALRYLTHTIKLCEQCKNPEYLESWPGFTPTQAGKTHR